MEIVTKQITVEVNEDSPGTLAAVTGILSRHAVNILAMTASGNRRDGHVHFVVDHTDLAYNILSNHGYKVELEDVLCISVRNVAGALHKALQALAGYDINIEYIYAYAKESDGVAVIKCDGTSHATNILTTHFKEFRKE